jgi:acyl-CoA oxidase
MAFQMESWKKLWIAQVKNIPHENVTYQESAEYLRRLIKTGLLTFTDAQDNPEKFFEAHRLLVGLESPGFSM